MTGRERIAALMELEMPDQYGLFEHFWPETLREHWPRQGYPLNEQGAPVDPVEHFGYDIQSAGGGVDTVPRRSYSEVVEETEEWRVTRDGRGAVLKYWKHKSGTPEHIDFEVTSPKRWAEYRDLITEFDPGRVEVEGSRAALAHVREKERFSVFGTLGFLEILRGTLGDLCMMESFLLEPAWIHDINGVYLDLFEKHYEYLFREAGRPDGIFVYDDLGYSNGLFCSPATCEELLVPYYRELFDLFHSYGLTVILHSCGDVRRAVPLMVDAGIDCLQPMEAKAGCDVIELAEEFGDRIAFMGNVDVTVLNTNSRDAVREEVVHKLRALKRMGTAYVFHSDHSVPPDVHLDTYSYALELYREFGRLE